MRETEVEQTNHCNVYNGWDENECITFVFAADTDIEILVTHCEEVSVLPERPAAVEVWVRDPR